MQDGPPSPALHAIPVHGSQTSQGILQKANLDHIGTSPLIKTDIPPLQDHTSKEVHNVWYAESSLLSVFPFEFTVDTSEEDVVVKADVTIGATLNPHNGLVSQGL